MAKFLALVPLALVTYFGALLTALVPNAKPGTQSGCSAQTPSVLFEKIQQISRVFFARVLGSCDSSCNGFAETRKTRRISCGCAFGVRDQPENPYGGTHTCSWARTIDIPLQSATFFSAIAFSTRNLPWRCFWRWAPKNTHLWGPTITICRIVDPKRCDVFPHTLWRFTGNGVKNNRLLIVGG